MATYTLQALLDSTQKFASWRGPGYANAEGLELVETIPYKGMKTVVFHWRVKPSPLKRNKDGSIPKGARKPSFYDVYIEFQQIKFASEENQDEIKSDGTWAKLDYKGVTYYYQKPVSTINPVRIRCSCMDFIMRFEEPNYRQGLLYGGTYHKYTRKTPPPEKGGRPYVNPEKIVGFCKHIYACIVRSITEGWVLGSKR